MTAHSFTNADDARLVELLSSARRRVVLAAPGISAGVAEALAAAWDRLGSAGVHVVLDVDAEVCRLGYGTIDGLKALQDAAQRRGCTVGHQRGIRIGILVSDDATLVFSPTPLLVEAGRGQADRPNAILLGVVPEAVASDLGMSPGATGPPAIGSAPLDEIRLKRVERDLSNAPPQPFDLARQVRVFTNRFQFVELKLAGCQISRRRVRIPSEFVGLAKSKSVEERFHAHVDLMQSGSLEVTHGEGEGMRRITEASIQQERKQIERDFMTVLPDYGSVILRSRKAEFEEAVRALEETVQIFSEGIKEALQIHIDASRQAVVDALLPAVAASPPTRWSKIHGSEISRDLAHQQLSSEIGRAFGTPEDLVDEMKLKLVFKDLTYESLVDPKFVATARKAMPGVEFLHEEYDAAAARTEGT